MVTDRPDDATIDDDDKLDQWYTAYLRDVSRKMSQKNKGSGNWREASDVAFGKEGV